MNISLVRALNVTGLLWSHIAIDSSSVASASGIVIGRSAGKTTETSRAAKISG